MVSQPRETSLEDLARRVTACRRCPRLVRWREEVARQKRAAYREDDYWGLPVPSFGDPAARLVIVGLAPGAHGANRTGRMFTGDRSGDWLYRALHRVGLASQPDSVSRDDGLALRGAWITAAVRCAPPANRPTAAEQEACRPYLEDELRLLARATVIVALGRLAWDAALRTLRRLGLQIPSPKPAFAHGAEVLIGDPFEPRAGGTASSLHRPVTLLGSYHPSQQNTFTGRLTEQMFDAIWRRAVQLSG